MPQFLLLQFNGNVRKSWGQVVHSHKHSEENLKAFHNDNFSKEKKKKVKKDIPNVWHKTTWKLNHIDPLILTETRYENNNGMQDFKKKKI